MFETESRGLLRLLLAGICLFWGRAELIHVDISKLAVWCFESLCSLSVNLFLVWCFYSNHFLHTSYREWWRHNSERFSSFAEVLSPMFLLFVLHLTGWAGPHREAQGSHVCPACREEMANLLQQKEGKNLSLCSVSNLTSASTSLLLQTGCFCWIAQYLQINKLPSLCDLRPHWFVDTWSCDFSKIQTTKCVSVFFCSPQALAWACCIFTGSVECRWFFFLYCQV